MSRKCLPAAAAVLLLMVSACGREQPSPEPDYPNALLARVPADTPYLMASGEPMPEALNERFRETLRPILDELRADLDTQFEALEQVDQQTASRLRAGLDKFLALAEEGGFDSTGLTRDDHLVIYGDGLRPVVRMTVSDPAAFRGFLEEVYAIVGVQPSTAEHAGVDYWRSEIGPVLVAAGLDDGVFSVGVAPLDAGDRMLAHLFEAPPAQTVASTGKLSDVADSYGFVPHGAAYVDTVRLMDLLIGERGLLQELDVLPAELTAECRAEIRDFAALTPRLVAGYDAMEDKRLAMRSVLELDPAVAGEVAGWSAAVPGLGPSDEALMVFGFGLDGVEAVGSVQRWLRQAGTREFDCQRLNDTDWAAAAGKLNAGPLYMAGNPRGVVLRLDRLEIRDPEAADFSVEGSVVALLENAQAVAAMAKGFVPGLQELDVPADGTPVALPEQTTEQIQQPAFAAMTDTLLGMSVGEDGEAQLRAAMQAEPVDPAPAFHVTLDAGWFYGQLAEWMPRAAELADSEGDDPEAREQLERSAEMMRAYAELFDRLHYGILLTDNGIEFAQEVNLQ